MYQKILVPLDGSKLAEGVLPHARSLAYAQGAELILLRVAVNPALEFTFSDPSLATSVVEDLETQSKKYMAGVEEQLKQDGFRVSSTIREGAVAEVILRTAEELHADIIAMSTHGRSGAARWLLGSVADRVVRNSNIPVLLIRARA